MATAEGSEHPVPSSPAQGARYTAAVLAALCARADIWAKTVLLVMFDENNGFFDHVPPPAAPSWQHWNSEPCKAVLAGASSVTTAGEYHDIASIEAGESEALMHRPYGLGPRVPMYVISPWSTNMTPWRRAVCGDLTSAFDFTRPDDRPFLAALPATGARAGRQRQLV